MGERGVVGGLESRGWVEGLHLLVLGDRGRVSHKQKENRNSPKVSRDVPLWKHGLVFPRRSSTKSTKRNQKCDIGMPRQKVKAAGFLF